MFYCVENTEANNVTIPVVDKGYPEGIVVIDKPYTDKPLVVVLDLYYKPTERGIVYNFLQLNEMMKYASRPIMNEFSVNHAIYLDEMDRLYNVCGQGAVTLITVNESVIGASSKWITVKELEEAFPDIEDTPHNQHLKAFFAELITAGDCV